MPGCLGIWNRLAIVKKKHIEAVYISGIPNTPGAHNIYSVSFETIFNILKPLAQLLNTPRQLLSTATWHTYRLKSLAMFLEEDIQCGTFVTLFGKIYQFGQKGNCFKSHDIFRVLGHINQLDDC